VKDQMGTKHHGRSRSSFTKAIILPATVKVAFGAALTILIMATWQQFVTLAEQREAMSPWEKVQEYAIFYPRSIGNDQQEIEAGGNASTVAEARDLYPILTKSGGIYIDSINYQPGAPKDTSSPWPVPPIRVNNNFLKQYPIMDSDRHQIDVDDEEQAWVVAVPERFKGREAQIENLLRTMRTGGPGITGAVQAEKRITGIPAPDRFSHQNIRIIWMATGQKVFSFDPQVDPEHGNMIVDPIVEIMTPDNSLTVDRLNSITGSLDTGLKVRVDGTPAVTLATLTPTLKKLRLEDNLQHLVNVHEAMSTRVEQARSSIKYTTALGGVALLITLALDTTMVVIGFDRLRRRIAVRRLHGVGFLRSRREIFFALWIPWLGQTLLAGAIVTALGTNTVSTPGNSVNPYSELPQLICVAIGSLAVEALLIFAAAFILESRNKIKQLKEL